MDTKKLQHHKLDKFMFNKLIAMERNSIGLSQETFGKILDVDAKTISAYENYSIMPSTQVIEKLLKHFKYKLKVIDRWGEEIEFY